MLYILLGVDSRASYNVCQGKRPETELSSLADWASREGKEVGVVTTTRLTHATPAAMYAKSANRKWEADTSTPEGCQDIASQLVSSLQEGKINLALGGGRRNFQTTAAQGGVRADRDLLEEFKASGGTVLNTLDDLQRWDYTNSTLGVFSSSNMEWEMVRARGEVVEPSLTEMTRQAITKLQRSKAGFVLMVEGGRIDHAHHKNQAKKALVETLELERAVEAALSLTRREETLIIVTADHRFVFLYEIIDGINVLQPRHHHERIP